MLLAVVALAGLALAAVPAYSAEPAAPAPVALHGVNPAPTPTAFFAQYWGKATLADGTSPVPVGAVVEAFNPRGNVVGSFTVTAAGFYGYMRVYGEDSTATPPIAGMRSGEAVTFKVNGVSASTSPSQVVWRNELSPIQVDLRLGSSLGPPASTATTAPSPTSPPPTATTQAGTTPAPTATPLPTVTSAPPGATPVPPIASLPPPSQTGGRFFPETGFRVNQAQFLDYFDKRGGIGTFGYPVSRQFNLLGFPVQFFQRAILQAMPDGGVARMNLLDEGLMPYTRINFSTFPGPDAALTSSAPSPADPDYGEKAIQFLRDNVPDEWEGMPVNFLRTFLGTVRYEDAFPLGDGEPALVPLLNLELWGLPTSKPAYDPNNRGFVYQRFQRGIMHYDAATGATQGLLLADYLKSIITGQNLPPDLDAQASGSRFYRQLDAARPNHLARPGELPGTNLAGAFVKDTP